MKSIITALAMLAALPLSAHSKQEVSHNTISGSIQFSGKISAPTCEISRNDGQYISSCYRETAFNTNEFIQMPLDNMGSELMGKPIRESVFNDPSLQRITLIYN
ncbi:hypothetical protein [Serratia fonticola]|uniref:hypothetical protein n=1 Tax=Serratia fonticola TaxID=47917 RepID=UPI002178CE10|nr:hypothetical protein [Serratia fonticola]CAI0916888.1 Uncharacterised protein [Serratia fonticola]